MNCKEFAMMASDLAGEKLIEASKYKLALAHKNSCPRCAARLANERLLTKALQVTASAETEQASAHTKAALLKAFAERTFASPAPRALPALEVAPIASPSNLQPSAPANQTPPAPVSNLFDISAARTPRRKTPPWTWVAAAAMIIALLTLAAMSFLSPHQTEPNPEANGVQQPTPEPKPRNDHAPAAQEQNQEPPKIAINTTPPQHIRKNVPDREQIVFNKTQRVESSTDGEITTDYIPLSYVSEATAMESGHVVRMMVSRSTLMSMGLPMNVERDKEMVKADVVVGDDGLARAIRFVYSESQNKNR